MKNLRLKTLFVSLAASVLFSVSAHASEFVFIINAQNTYASTGDDAKKEVRRLFLKEKTAWPDGTKAKPLGPVGGSPAHESFLTNVLSMDAAAMAQHWLRVKQTTGQTPPREIKSDRLLTKMVGRDKGAFAVVGADVELPPEVKVLFKL